MPGQWVVGEQLPPQWSRPGAPYAHGLMQTPPLDLENGGRLLARRGQPAFGLRHNFTVLALASGGQSLTRTTVGVRQADGQVRSQTPQELALSIGQVQQAIVPETDCGDTAVTELASLQPRSAATA